MSGVPPNDTHPKIEALLIEGYRKMSPAQKLERVRALTRAVQELALLDVRRAIRTRTLASRRFGSLRGGSSRS